MQQLHAHSPHIVDCAHHKEFSTYFVPFLLGAAKVSEAQQDVRVRHVRVLQGRPGLAREMCLPKVGFPDKVYILTTSSMMVAVYLERALKNTLALVHISMSTIAEALDVTARGVVGKSGAMRVGWLPCPHVQCANMPHHREWCGYRGQPMGVGGHGNCGVYDL